MHTTPSMSYTIVDDEDDTDICPVCDGQCTCRPHPAPPSIPSLKIKFTLPQSLRQSTTTTPLKKRGRPPKQSNKVTQNLKAKAAAIPKKKRRRVIVQSDQDSSDTDSRRIYNRDEPKFPTFVSASSISSTSDSSSSTSPFDSDPDSDIQAEEENFILTDIHDKARLRRDLLEGDDDPLLKKRSPTHDWVIRSRKKSVAGSDAEQMDVDTDDQAENQDDDDDDDDEEEEEEDETDVVHRVEEEDDGDTDQRHHYIGLATGWSEEEDESSFDADLFFANLSDSDSDSTTSSTSTRRRCHSYTPGGIDADQSSSTSESSPSRTALPFEVTENWDGQLIFTNGEVESRGIVDIDFEKDAERYADDDDDDSYSSYSSSHGDHLNYHPPSTAQVPESSDIDMFSISDADAGYEEEDGGAEGDTTDEELVGDDCLPNERAMRLFTLPMPMPMPMGMGIGVSAINPMSTVSPAIGLEKRRHRRGKDVNGDREDRKKWRRRLRLGAGAGPRAADILAGKIVFWGDESTVGGYASSSSDSMAEVIKGKGKQKAFFSPSSSPDNYPRQSQIPSTPRSGLFVPTSETRQAVIGENRKGIDVPSPHPRFNGRRSRVSVVQYLLKKHLQSQSQSPVVPPASTTNTNGGSSPSIISDAPSTFHRLLLSSAASPLTNTEDTTNGGDEYDTGASTPCPCPEKVEVDETTCLVELDDVLEASFLDDSMDRECIGSSSLAPTSDGLVQDSPMTPTNISTADSTAAAEASNKHLKRWDVISIGAFRQTREQQQQQAWGPGSRSTSTVADYGSVIKSSASAPLSTLLWQNTGAGAGSSKKTSSMPRSKHTSRSSTKAAKRRRLMASSTISSPLVLPLSSTSLSTPPSKAHSSSFASSHSQPNPTTAHKTRKELRREKKLLKKKTTSSSPSSMPQQPFFFTTHPYVAHPNNASNNNNNHHQFHTHQHYPNLKTRGMSSSQRMGFAGGAVPPLNL